MLPSEIGERAEAAVLAALAGAGKRVLLPFGDRRYDLAYEENGRLVRVQCKAGSVRKGAVCFRTHSVGRSSIRDYRGEVDLFGVYCHERGEVYLVPVHEVPTRRGSLRIAPTRNGQTTGVRLAADYVIAPARSGTAEPYIDKRRSMSDGGVVTQTSLELPVLCCAPLAASSVSDAEAEATAQLFKALADPHRVRIVNLLVNAGEPVCVCDITETVGLSQPTISFHLKKLVASGLLQREKRGTWAYYSLDPAALDRLTNVVAIEGANR